MEFLGCASCWRNASVLDICIHIDIQINLYSVRVTKGGTIYPDGPTGAKTFTNRRVQVEYRLILFEGTMGRFDPKFVVDIRHDGVDRMR